MKITDNAGSPATIATYEYDGLGRRIRKAVGSDKYDYYYNESWQVVEVRLNGDANPLEQFAYDTDYIDAVAMRWYDADMQPSQIESSGPVEGPQGEAHVSIKAPTYIVHVNGVAGKPNTFECQFTGYVNIVRVEEITYTYRKPRFQEVQEFIDEAKSTKEIMLQELIESGVDTSEAAGYSRYLEIEMSFAAEIHGYQNQMAELEVQIPDDEHDLTVTRTEEVVLARFCFQNETAFDVETIFDLLKLLGEGIHPAPKDFIKEHGKPAPDRRTPANELGPDQNQNLPPE